MSNIMISYNRQSEAITKSLARDIEDLGHNVWFDQDLSGGQAWWDQILANVRDCDICLFALSAESLNSTACKREYGYAANLGKPILPVLVSGEISTNLLPPALSQIQFVDYRQQDRNSIIRLSRALNNIPSPKPIPDPLPTPPEVPISYLGSLVEKVESTSYLSYEEQSTLLLDLKRSLRDVETADDGRMLLLKMRKRHDLLVTIAEEIDELLAGMPKDLPEPGHTREEGHQKEVFISYSKEDVKRASVLEEALKEQGWSVWRDHEIPPGQIYDEFILWQLKSAKCVIVLWTKNSVSSQWVKDEAQVGADRNVLFPVLLDEVEIPMGFRRFQVANLVGWNGLKDDPAFVSLIKQMGNSH